MTTRLQVYQAMLETGLVPVHYDPDAERAVETLAACARGGARVFEFTNRGIGAHEVFARLRPKALACGIALGVGSVVDPATAALYLQLGAAFVVSPSLNLEVGRLCNRRKIAWIPGCATPSEIGQAEEAGAEIVKIFPAGGLGPEFVKALRGPSPWTTLMPSGGVLLDPESLRAWFQAGVGCVGAGSFLKGTPQEVEERVRVALEVIEGVRSGAA